MNCMHLVKRLAKFVERGWEKEKMVGARRFEHPTSSSQNWRSTKLSYAPTKPRRGGEINKIRFQSKIGIFKIFFVKTSINFNKRLLSLSQT